MMPAPQPPRPFTVALPQLSLSAGTPLWRQAPRSALGPVFRDDVPDTCGDGRMGGRFDPTPDCRYPFTYVALDPVTALAETVLRDLPYGPGGRVLPSVRTDDQALTVLEPSRPLDLIRLIDAEDLAAARTDTWLIHAERPDYPTTRRWAHWFRECSPRADGLVWPSKRHPGGRVALLFGDADRSGLIVAASPLGVRPLDSQDGRRWLTGLLAPLHTFLEP